MTKTTKLLSILVIFVIVALKGGQTSTIAPFESTTFKPIDFSKEKDAIVANIKRQYEVLKSLSYDFGKLFQNESKQLKGAYKDVAEKVSWYFKEPMDNETMAIDLMLNKFYPLGGPEEDYLDTKEKFDDFCKNHDKYLDSFRSWIRRKYIQNVLIQVSFNMIINKIDKTVDSYCHNVASKEGYVANMNKIKAINGKLMPAKSKLFDQANFIKNSTNKLPKMGRLCCNFWEFVTQLKEGLKDSKVEEFTLEMTKSFFSSATDYLCYFYKAGAEICKEIPSAPPTQPKYRSFIMEMALTISDIVI